MSVALLKHASDDFRSEPEYTYSTFPACLRVIEWERQGGCRGE